MTRAAGGTLHGTPELELTGLLVPRIQRDPLPIRLVEASPCSEACPAGINVKSYVSLIAEGRFSEALAVVREQCPLPGICGRICHHPCEAACKRCEIDEPIAIRSLKRFVADLALEEPAAPPSSQTDKTERIAVIGSGPAGLTAAYDLRRAGYPVTVFEAESEAGGMLRYGIADYRLPPDVLDAEIAFLEAAGIDIETDCRIGRDRELVELFAEDFSTALFAVGAQRGRRLGIAGEDDCPQVEDALGFLRRVNEGDHTPVRGTVLVIGGGSTAVEAARTALRLGADAVEIVYRRHRGEMPADDEEIELAAAEGVGLRLLTAPARVVTDNGALQGLRCLEVALGEPDASGRRRPIPIPGSDFLIAADRLLTAVGQEAVLDFLPPKVASRLTERGLIAVVPGTSMTAMRGIFAAGDVVSGPATVIEAVAAGHEAAAAIRRFLECGDAMPRDDLSPAAPAEYEIPLPPPARAPRLHPPHEAIAIGTEFAEVERSFSSAEAMAEARRCLRCGPCSECLVCAPTCGRRHVTLRSTAESSDTALLLRAPAGVAAGLEVTSASAWLVPRTARGKEDVFDSKTARPYELQPARVTIEPRRCRGCARCIDVCAFDAISLADVTAPETHACVDSTLCRGCSLCAAVCPTDAVVASSFSPAWWGKRIEDLYPRLLAAGPKLQPTVAFACQRRAATVEASLRHLAVQVVPLRCAGQLDAGMLLELYRHGAARIVVAGCLTGSCRYGFGPQLAARQVLRANTMLAELGAGPGVVAVDWAADAEEPFEPPLPGPVAARSPAATETECEG